MSWARDHFVGLDHVQLAMPADGAKLARTFYLDTLGMAELATSDPKGTGNALCFAGGDGANIQLHLSTERAFAGAGSCYPAIVVAGLDDLADRLTEAGHEVDWLDERDGLRTFGCADPFGNRIVFISTVEDH